MQKFILIACLVLCFTSACKKEHGECGKKKAPTTQPTPTDTNK